LDHDRFLLVIERRDFAVDAVEVGVQAVVEKSVRPDPLELAVTLDEGNVPGKK
jgi:hypothetical protein